MNIIYFELYEFLPCWKFHVTVNGYVRSVMDLVQIMDVNLEVTIILKFEDLYTEYPWLLEPKCSELRQAIAFFQCLL